MYLLPEHCFSSSRIFPQTGTFFADFTIYHLSTREALTVYKNEQVSNCDARGPKRTGVRSARARSVAKNPLVTLHLNLTQCSVYRNITVPFLSLLNDRCLIVLFICLLFYTECLSKNVYTWGVCLRRGVVNICTQLSALPPRLYSKQSSTFIRLATAMD